MKVDTGRLRVDTNINKACCEKTGDHNEDNEDEDNNREKSNS